jgi:regulator of protease activity HflC (stomatin/prohibitin superfamily)
MNRQTTLVAGCLAVAAAMLSGCVPRYTGPTEVGVRTVKFSLFGKKGVENKVYAPGATYFFVPFLSDWHTFDTSLNSLLMSGLADNGDRTGGDDLLFKTIDGNDISLDIRVDWRINPENAPMILQNVATDMEELKDNIVRTVARSKPRDIFGELNAELFYKGETRDPKAEEVKVALNLILKDFGVIVETVSTSDYRFVPEYQVVIEDRMVADQRVKTAQSTTEATVEQFRASEEEAKGEADKMKAEADGTYKQAEIKADAAFNQEEKRAEAVRIEGQAEAAGIRKMNEALAGSGGESVVKLAVAEALQGKKIVLVPMGEGFDVRSTNINDLLKMYGMGALGNAADAKPPKKAQENGK